MTRSPPRHLSPVRPVAAGAVHASGDGDPAVLAISATDGVPRAAATGMATAEALAAFLRHLANRRGRSGHVTSSHTVRAYASALPVAFAGIAHLGELTAAGRDRLHANFRAAWGGSKATTFNARRAAVGSAVSYFHDQGWTPDAGAVLTGLDREYQPKPDDARVRTREQIDQLIDDERRSLQDRTLWALLYATAARATEVLSLDVTDLDRASRRARTQRKGGKRDELLYDLRTARMLGQLLGIRAAGPLFLSARVAMAGTVRAGDGDPDSGGRRRMTYRTADRHLAAATRHLPFAGYGWNLHDLRHSRLTHLGEAGASELDLMILSGHEDRDTLQRYLHPTKEGAHRRIDDIDTRRSAWTPEADEIAARMAASWIDE